MTVAKESWEDEVDLAEAQLQGYVEKLQEKAEREVARILKVRVCVTTLQWETRLALTASLGYRV